MSANAKGRARVVASEEEARKNVTWAADVKLGDTASPGWPVRPVIDLCVLVAALIARVDTLERTIGDHVAAINSEAHPPF